MWGSSHSGKRQTGQTKALTVEAGKAKPPLTTRRMRLFFWEGNGNQTSHEVLFGCWFSSFLRFFCLKEVFLTGFIFWALPAAIR